MVNPSRKATSFSHHILEAWSRCIERKGEYIIPFPSVQIADLFRKECYAFRTSIENTDVELFYQYRTIKILMVKLDQIELPCGELDPSVYACCLVMIDDDKIFGESMRKAEEINKPHHYE